jgi:hypothetical protein
MAHVSENLKQSLELASRTAVKSPDFLATRVMAELEPRRGLRVTIWAFASGIVASLAVAVAIVSLRDTTFEANVWQPQVVKVDVEEFVPGEQLEAEVILPHGVEFFSTAFPELREQRTLRLAVGASKTNPKQMSAPFVVRGLDVGRQKIKVKFYNQQQELVLEKQVEIKFKVEGT